MPFGRLRSGSGARRVVDLSCRRPATKTSRAPSCLLACTGGGDVNLSNSNESGDAAAVNHNSTEQWNGQGQLAEGGDATSGNATSEGCGCQPDDDGKPHKDKGKPDKGEPRGNDGVSSGNAEGGDVDQDQHASNANHTHQDADAETTAWQFGSGNSNLGTQFLGFPGMARRK